MHGREEQLEGALDEGGWEGGNGSSLSLSLWSFRC